MTSISIYDGSTLLAAVTDVASVAWRTARSVVNALAADAGRGRSDVSHREWFRCRGRVAYQRAGFRAINTFSGR